MGTGWLLERTQRLLRRYGLQARKGLGQHFLVDEATLENIIAAADLTQNDVVVEVGPGLGALTAELAQRAGKVITIELDDKLAALIKKEFAEASNVSVLNQDVLKTDIAALLKSQNVGSYKVVANLPYYITSPTLRHFLEAEVKPQSMVVMVQKEVAEEIAARAGRMSLLSVGMQFYGKPEIVARVPAAAFHPAPAVDSAVVRITPYLQLPWDVADVESFFRFVRAGFSAARKQLTNSLAQGLNVSKEQAQALLNNAGIDSGRRAETLSISEWVSLWRAFSGKES